MPAKEGTHLSWGREKSIHTEDLWQVPWNFLGGIYNASQGFTKIWIFVGPVLTTLKVTSFLDVSVQVQHKEKNQLSYQ